MTGAITGYIDTAQLVLYLFWFFFAGLLFYLRREDRREGYPLESAVDGKTIPTSVIYWPDPKTFALADGGKVMAPDAARTDRRAIPGEPVAAWPGAPLEPTGNPFDLGVGPGSWAARADKPDMALDGKPKIMALRVANGFSLEARDPDPRGMPVVGADGVVAGKVVDVWVDRAEVLIRYLEVDLGIESSGEAEGEAARTVLLPVNFAVIDGGFTLLTDKSGKVYVEAINGDQFAGIPVTKNKTQLTMLEEEKIVAYFGAGTLYADAKRAEPWL